ncbi:ethyl tert-butyl ether degradation protein EthD [Burkholderia stabilis]|uniref:EthD family reductase n=1 Tax=Burkholderia stabilis TaxID=95485 RepID=UPI0008519D4D|nr:EthD family reductase [Burkholderia stabilis]AOR72821.1 ethyl tert-butyl ether degradation protein EthD [Burkholderia stabilis]HDR9492314.1 EthD family reductase [Burkholderia stabilis]HDR9496462.1 EthD family reductase [Burkholderia stabilis]HDR9522856.1 EthD family reductase [Burkholderia stabilis]HDR9528347.1 EthD family reductase [Burkholderia stabilis]
MSTLIVSYPRTEGATFDREYYLSKHGQLVGTAWSKFGLQSAEFLFPSSTRQPFVCVAILRFGDQAGIDMALSSGETREVMSDVKNFTDITPTIFRADD